MRYQSVLVLGFLTAIATQAQSASLKTFEAGERVKAAEVNGNFEYLEQKIDPLVTDSAPTIEILNFGYDSSAARYTGDLTVSDDTELFRIKVQIGQIEASADFYEALTPQDLLDDGWGEYVSGGSSDDSHDDSDEHEDEHGDEHEDEHGDEHGASGSNLARIKEFWPAPSTKDVRILGAQFSAEQISGGPVQIIAQDTSGKLRRLVIEVPAWPGGLFSSGVYVLDSSISLNLAAVETACGVNARNNSPFRYGDIVSYTLYESTGDTAPVAYSVYDNFGRGGSTEADADESEIQFNLGGATGYSSGIGSWYSKGTITMTFVSDSVVSFDAYYECGTRGEGNNVPAFTYSSGEITAVLTAQD